jgi:hypothetical protein
MGSEQSRTQAPPTATTTTTTSDKRRRDGEGGDGITTGSNKTTNTLKQ